MIGALRATGVLDVCDRHLAAGTIRGAQVYVSHEGRPVLDECVGSGEDGRGLSTNSILSWACAGKPLTAMALACLADQGRLSFEAPIEDYVEGLRGAGVGTVALDDLLSHGVAYVDPDPLAAHAFVPTAELIGAARDIALRPDPILPVSQCHYTAWTAWKLATTVLESVGRGGSGALIRELVLEPMGLHDCWVGLPEERRQQYGDLVVPVHSEGRVVLWDYPAAISRAMPAVGARGPARQLGAFYEQLMRLLAGDPGVISAARLQQLITPVRAPAMDVVERHEQAWGLGFSRRVRTVAPWASPSAFGHTGLRTSLAFADPVSGVVLVYLLTTMDDPVTYRRFRKDVCAALAADLVGGRQ